MKKGKKFMMHLVSLGILCAGFILCRYVLFDIHGMKQWPCLLFVCGVAIISISFFLKAKRVSIFTALSYSIGFLAGLIFQTDGVDAGGGGRTNNFWVIWTVVFAFGIVIAAASELIAVMKKRSDRNEKV